MNARAKTLCVCVLLALAGCDNQVKAPGSKGKCSEYASRLPTDPEAAATRRYVSGLKQFLAVQGYAVEVPGITDKVLIEKLGYRVLRGTSDAFEDESCSEYQKKATAYASRYNFKIRELHLNGGGQ